MEIYERNINASVSKDGDDHIRTKASLLDLNHNMRIEIKVRIKDKYDKNSLPQVWDELRRKVNDHQRQLPPGAGPSIVNDDFGDVYGVYLAIIGDNMIGSDVLCNTTGFHIGYAGFADNIEQRGFTMVDMAHDGNHRRSFL